VTNVAVVIAAFNQTHVVGEAIDSAVNQTGVAVETTVVDDGSTDDTAAVAAARSGVTLIRQANSGPAAARVAGLDASTSEFVVFLDGDDRLRPGALARGVEALRADPALGFASGRCIHIDADGSPLATEVRPPVADGHYRELLRQAYIYPPAAVMFRRSALDAVRPLNTSRRFEGADDLELYLRVARRHPVLDHGEVVVEYRRHGTNYASSHPECVLRSVTRVLRAERAHTRADPELERARRAGLAHWQHVFGYELAVQARRQLSQRDLTRAARTGAALLRWASPAVIRAVRRKVGRLGDEPLMRR
jgi:glycosyltransferase involved in cell wall biosynthesis